MQRYQIIHRTYYNFSAKVKLGLHTLRLRPKENHELRIEASILKIIPTPVGMHWYRDVEGNSVIHVGFDSTTDRLAIESEVVVQQYNQTPLNFWVNDYAVHYPFSYEPEDGVLLTPYIHCVGIEEGILLRDWLDSVWGNDEQPQTYALLQRINQHIYQSMAYQVRETQGVQSVAETLSRGRGACRDFAYLFMATARHLGIAARFVSGYLQAPPTQLNFGATHAWAEVYLPGAGWKGFDPTVGDLAGSDHIAVATARMPGSIPPITGSYVGLSDAHLDVGVWVSPLEPA